MGDKRREDWQQITDRRREETIDFDQLMKEFEAQRRERNRRGRNKSKKRGRRWCEVIGLI